MHATAYTRSPDRAAGFTLIELAVVLFILTLLLSSLLVPLATQVDQRNISDTQKTLEDIKEALVGFAITRGYLPCTDVTSGAGANDGVEDVNAATGVCVSSSAGNVPWVTLGLGASDVWGNRFRYRVEANFAQHPPASVFNLTTGANLVIWTSTAKTVRLVAPSPDSAVAVILSLGKNGLGAINAITGTANPAPPAGSDEDENMGGLNFVSRTRTDIRTPCSDTVAGQPLCEFDDIVTWLGKYTLFQRMVAAGKKSISVMKAVFLARRA